MTFHAIARQARFYRHIAWLSTVALLLVTVGCSRSYYRRQADQDVNDLVRCASRQTGWPLRRFTIRPDAQSRMFDPSCPDRPPMPPDDPASHRLMHCVDCKPGAPCWHKNGKTPFVENPDWQRDLPLNENGELVLDRRQAMIMALQHSRTYQEALESLYLSALDVTFQRFRFDTQFFGGNATSFTSHGENTSSAGANILATDTDLQMRKLFASGGEMVVGVANSLVWQFAGPDTYGANTLLDFSLVQPLLRAGGRTVVLEQLTDAERALLANIRQMERFRRGFYAQVTTGRNAGTRPVRGGIGLGAISSGVVPGAGGFLGLLEQQVRIRNQKSNVADLHESLGRLQAFYDSGRINSNQVNRAQQSLLRAQSRLLNTKSNYETRLDSYRIQLGLPPDLNVKIEEPILAQFDFLDPTLMATRERVSTLLQLIRDLKTPAEIDPATPYGDELAAIRRECLIRLEEAHEDLQHRLQSLPRRRESLRFLAGREEIQEREVDPALSDVAALDGRTTRLQEALAEVSGMLLSTLEQMEPFERAADGPLDETSRETLQDLADALSSKLLELSLVKAQARLDAVTLEPIYLGAEEALAIARENRRDWMNARAALVDTWRQIEVRANDLQSDLDITFSGDLGTTDNHPLRFRGTTGRLRAGLEFDAPLTRLVERNAYREAIISYQRARRDFYAAEDRINQGLRGTIRSIQLNQLDFEISRAAVFVAVSRVDESQERLVTPPVGTQRVRETLAQDLVDALQSLLDAQNDFLAIWVNQEALRLNLDFDLGTMQLDAQGMWIDPATQPIAAEQRPADRPADHPVPVAPDQDPNDIPNLLNVVPD